MDDLFQSKGVDTGDTGTVGTDIYRLRKLDKFRAGSVSPTDEDRNLKAETGRTAS